MTQAVSEKLVGKPDGPKVFVPEIGYEVGTFTTRREDLEGRVVQAGMPCLMHHVPVPMRGPYRPEQLANYDPDVDYNVDNEGYRICGAINKHAKTDAARYCKQKCLNRSDKCTVHGGKLHPLDKQVPRVIDPTTMTRWQLLRHGYIDVDDLDDEELVRGMCRRPDGDFPPDAPKSSIPRPIYDKMVNRLFDRAQEMFRENLFAAIGALAEVVGSDAYEPADRLRASQMIIDRALGKAPEKVDVTVGTKPYEQIFAGFRPSTRADNEQRALEGPPILEAEVEWNANEQPAEHSDTDPETNASQPDAPTPKFRRTTRNGTENSTESSSGSPRRMMRRKPVAPAASPEEREERVKEARQRRYAARAMGRKTTSNLPYIRSVFPDKDSDGKLTGLYRIQWTPPDAIKVPASVKARDTRRRNNERFR